MWVIELLKNKRKKWFHRLRSSINGRTIYHSESYSSKTAAMRTVNVLRKSIKKCAFREVTE